MEQLPCLVVRKQPTIFLPAEAGPFHIINIADIDLPRYVTRMIEAQQSVCERYGVDFTPPEGSWMLGVSESALRGEMPLHGVRHPFESGSTGWFIWSGDYSDADNFFKPVHLYHLQEGCPTALPYLALPPGWRFLIAPEYEDVWFDSSLLNV